MTDKARNSIGEEIDPNHRVTVEESDQEMVVSVAGEEIARTRRPLILHEGNYPATAYFPPEDVRWKRLEATRRVTHCPYKGDASYWTIRAAGQVLENAAWSYQAPLVECPRIRGYLAFYSDRVTIERRT